MLPAQRCHRSSATPQRTIKAWATTWCDASTSSCGSPDARTSNVRGHGHALLVITGRAAVLRAAPSAEECIERWNGALDDETVELDVRPRGVHLTSQGAAGWDGRYPVSG